MKWTDFLEALRENGRSDLVLSDFLRDQADSIVKRDARYRSRIEGDDVAQEAFLKIWSAVEVGSIDPHHPNVLSLLRTMVKQAAHDLYKKGSAKRHGGDAKRVFLGDDLLVSHEEAFEKAELADLLRTRLTSEESEIAVLISEECPLKTIAKIYDLSLTEAWRKVQKLKKKLSDFWAT